MIMDIKIYKLYAIDDNFIYSLQFNNLINHEALIDPPFALESTILCNNLMHIYSEGHSIFITFFVSYQQYILLNPLPINIGHFNLSIFSQTYQHLSFIVKYDRMVMSSNTKNDRTIILQINFLLQQI